MKLWKKLFWWFCLSFFEIYFLFLIFGQKLPSEYINKQEINTHKANFYRLHKIKFLQIFIIFFNWDSLHARLNSHYEAWSYKKKKHKKDYRLQKICLEGTYI